MIVTLLIAILCLFIFWRFTRSVEINERGEWKPFCMPLWAWLITVIIAIVPLVNFALLVGFIIIIIIESKGSYPDVRFTNKSGLNNFITKVINILNKEY